MGEERSEGVAAMGELPLLCAGDFGEGEVEGGDEEEGIVAEAVVSSGGVEELAFDRVLGAEQDLAVEGEGEGADEAGGAGGLVLHAVEEEGVVALVGGESGGGVEAVVVGEAGGADAGLLVEGGDFEAGVVGEDEEAAGGERVGDGFEVGVALEGGGVFEGLGDVLEAGEGENVDSGGAGAGGELGQLAGVGGGGVKNHDFKLHRVALEEVEASDKARACRGLRAR
jgi:hypothetical protein